MTHGPGGSPHVGELIVIGGLEDVEVAADAKASAVPVPSQRRNPLTAVLVRARKPRPDRVGVPQGSDGARRRRPPSTPVAIYGAALSIGAALLLGFLADLTFIGALHHNRDQRIGYAALRYELAKGEAPVGPLDHNGKPLPLGAPVALLVIPEIGVHEVVFEGTTSGVLEKGAGHARSSLLPGQAGTAIILGRKAAYGGPFRDIGKLLPGQTFTATTGQGTSTYRVLDVRLAGDPVPPAPAAGAGRLQLITAAGAAYQPNGLLRVDADLVSTPQGAPVVGFNIAPLAKAEGPLQGDSSVLVVLVLWAQALLIAAALVAWARVRWGVWEAWVVGLPLLAALGLAVADRVAQLLPNLM
ncbi:MAG: sortase [Frankiales bacterium]|nr:sortase [Frankiales bacterium]